MVEPEHTLSDGERGTVKADRLVKAPRIVMDRTDQVELRGHIGMVVAEP